MTMFEKKENADPRVTLIDPNKDCYDIEKFYGKNNYGKETRVGVLHEEFPDELGEVSEADLEGWEIVVTEYSDRYSNETETRWGWVEAARCKPDGWVLDYEA